MCTLKDIILDINNGKNMKELFEIVKTYNSDDRKEYNFFSEKKYKKNLVFRNSNFEVFIICWKPRQFSPIHDHSENGCILKIIKGELTEYIYNREPLKLIELNNLTKNSIGYIDNNQSIHKMINESTENCVSLHIYSPPNFVARIFTPSNN
jgi:cysteine dioxygenase